MTIWTYEDGVLDVEIIQHVVDTVKTCLFCCVELHSILMSQATSGSIHRDTFRQNKTGLVCPQCGWWIVGERIGSEDVGLAIEERYGAVARLKTLSTLDDSTMEEVRAILVADYSKRGSIDPWQFEAVVADVYRSHGFRTRVTARSGDGGIDVIMEGADDALVGVQIKRYKASIDVSQIRELTGALVLKGLVQGMFVTTSRFESGASTTVREASARGIKIELVDGERFFRDLGLAQRREYDRLDDPTAPFANVVLTRYHQSRRYRSL